MDIKTALGTDVKDPTNQYTTNRTVQVWYYIVSALTTIVGGLWLYVETVNIVH